MKVCNAVFSKHLRKVRVSDNYPLPDVRNNCSQIQCAGISQYLLWHEILRDDKENAAPASTKCTALCKYHVANPGCRRPSQENFWSYRLAPSIFEPLFQRTFRVRFYGLLLLNLPEIRYDVPVLLGTRLLGWAEAHVSERAYFAGNGTGKHCKITEFSKNRN